MRDANEQASAVLSGRSILGFAVLALFGALQFFGIIQLSATQRSNARLVLLAATGRADSQRIAYAALSAATGAPEPGWRDEIETAIAAIRAGRREALQIAPLPRTGAADRLETGVVLERYFTAAREIEADPSDHRALDALRRMRREVLTRLSRIVSARSAAMNRQTGWLIADLLGGLAIGVVTLVLVWLGLIVPAERRLRHILAAVGEERAQMQSLFDENPDAIAIYDHDANLVRTNRARAELIGRPAETMLGQHLSNFVDRSLLASALGVFEEARAGQRFTGEMQLLSAAGKPIDVHLNAFPNIVAGVQTGVMIVSRDISELKAAQLRSDELAGRLAALCLIVSVVSGDWREQVREALALAASALCCEWGLVGELAGDYVRVLSVAGEFPGMEIGTNIPLQMTMTQSIIASEEVFEFGDLMESSWRDYNAVHGTGWRNVIGMRLTVGARIFGAFAIGGRAPRAAPLAPADRDFIKTVAALIASIIERGHQHARLDSLAFCDLLTALPNRAFIGMKLEEVIARSRREDAVSFALHFIDLDRFKHINDTVGHAAGDAVLREVGRRFVHCVRSTDTVARLGGDEFLILQPMPSGRDGAALLAERIVKAVERPFIIDGARHTLGCSIGVSMFPADGSDAETLIKCADAAMYRAKADRLGGGFAFADHADLRG